MTEEQEREEQLAEGLQTIRSRLFNLKGYLESTGYPIVPITWVGEAIEVVTSLQGAVEDEPVEPTLSPYLHPTNEERAEHLARYLVNRAKRTGQEWVVVEQYKTEGPSGRGEESYHRALLKAEDGSTVRIYYRRWSKCWVRSQKVLAPKA